MNDVKQFFSKVDDFSQGFSLNRTANIWQQLIDVLALLHLRWLPSSVLLLLATSSSQVAAQQLLVDEPFSGNVTNGWRVGVDNPNLPSNQDPPCLTARAVSDTTPSEIDACPGGPINLPGLGVLRLTSNRGDQAGFALFDTPIPSRNGLVITFDTFVYGGSQPERLPGADGISFFLINGSVSPARAGAFGGSLGYAQRRIAGAGGADRGGVEGGYVGIGLDEFGNYSNSNEGRVGGIGFQPDAVAVRGSESIQYVYLTGTRTGEIPGLDFPNVQVRSETVRRTVRIILTPDNNISVDIDFNDGRGFVNVIRPLNLTAAQGPLPETFKFGFAASTGDQVNIHEIRTFRITTVPPNLRIDKSHVGDFTVGKNGVYTLRVENSASAGTTTGSITVTDTLPTGLNFVSGVGTNWNCSAVGQTVTCTYTGAAVPAGATLPDIALTVAVTEAVASTITNSATVSVAGDSDLSDNTDTDETTVIAAPILRAAKTASVVDSNGNGVTDAGDAITYTVTINNTGNAASTNTVFTDPIPANTAYVPNSTQLNGTTVADVDGNMPFARGEQVNSSGVPRGQINSGASATVSFQVRIGDPLSAGVTQISNQGRVQSDQISPPVLTDNPPVDVTSEPTITPIGKLEPRLRLVKRITAATRDGGAISGINFNTVDPNDDTSLWPPALPPTGVRRLGPDTPLQSGDEVEYTIYFLSDGTAPLINTQFCDLIPAGTTFVPNSIQAQLVTTTLPGTFYLPLAPLPVGNSCSDPTNPNGAVVVNLGDVSNVAGSNFGLIRFRVTID